MEHLLVFQQDGDVLIQIKNYKLLVSRQKLSSVSAVFAAMLNEHFREGGKIPFGDRQVHQVLLPEDDIDLVLLLCKIIYKRQDLIDGFPKGQCLLDLTVLCDKYQCVNSLQDELESMALHSLYFYGANDTQNLSTLLLVSYIIDSDEEFELISGYILSTFRARALEEKGRLSFYQLLHHPLVRVDFATKFELKYKELNQQIDRLLSDPFQGLRNCCCCGHPNTRAKRAGSFMEQLFKAKLMPTDIQRVSIREIKERVENLEEVHCHHFRYCAAPSKSLKEMLKEGVKDIQARGMGICLDCLKSNNRTALTGRCRTPHTNA